MRQPYLRSLRLVRIDRICEIQPAINVSAVFLWLSLAYIYERQLSACDPLALTPGNPTSAEASPRSLATARICLDSLPSFFLFSLHSNGRVIRIPAPFIRFRSLNYGRGSEGEKESIGIVHTYCKEGAIHCAERTVNLELWPPRVYA